MSSHEENDQVESVEEQRLREHLQNIDQHQHHHHQQSIPQYSSMDQGNTLPIDDDIKVENVDYGDVDDEEVRRSGSRRSIDKEDMKLHRPRQNRDDIGEPILAEDYFITPIFEAREFTDLSALKEYVKDFSKHNGFNIAISHSNNKAIYFTCELGGAYRNKHLRRGPDGNYVEQDDPNLKDPAQYTTEDYKKSKRMGSKKISCPFSIIANFSKKRNYWTLRVSNNHHNHPKLNPDEAAPIIRKRSNLVNDHILEFYKNGEKPSKIQEKLSILFPEVSIKREDIYNEIRILKKRRIVPASRAAPRNSKHDVLVDLNEEEATLVAATASRHNPHVNVHSHNVYHHHLQPEDKNVDVAAIIAATKKTVEDKEAAALALAVEQAVQYQQLAHLEAVAAAAALAEADEQEHKKQQITNDDVDDKLLQIDDRLVGEGN